MVKINYIADNIIMVGIQKYLVFNGRKIEAVHDRRLCYKILEILLYGEGSVKKFKFFDDKGARSRRIKANKKNEAYYDNFKSDYCEYVSKLQLYPSSNLL